MIDAWIKTRHLVCY